MLELTFIACLLVQPDYCKPFSLTYAAEPGTLLQCQMGVVGQAQIAKWMDRNSDWSVRRWKCRPAGQMAKA